MLGRDCKRWRWTPANWGLDPSQEAILGGVIVLSAVIYLRCVRNGAVWDDHEWLRSRLIEQWSFLWRSFGRDVFWFRHPGGPAQTAYYRPLEDVWFGINRLTFGGAFIWWHVAKLVVWVAGVGACFRLAQVLSRDSWVGLWAALLFAVLPSHVEAVAWVSAIPEPLSAFLEMAALSWFIDSKGITRVAGATALYAGSMFTHEIPIAFPLLVGLYQFLLGYQRDWAEVDVGGKPSRVATSVAASLPFFGVAMLYLALRLAALGSRAFLGIRKEQVASIGGMLATIPGAIVEYLKILAVPWLAGPAHAVTFVENPGFRNVGLPLLVLLGLAGAGYLAIRKHQRRSLYLFCGAWVVLNLAAALNLRQVTAPVQDRFVYASSFGWCLLWADYVVQWARPETYRRRLACALATGLMVICIIVVWQRQSIWRDDFTLFGRCVELAPDDPQFRARFARVLLDENRLSTAAEWLGRLSRSDSNNVDVHAWLAEVYTRLHRPEDAAAEYGTVARQLEAAVAADPRDAKLHIELGQTYSRLGRPQEALREFQRAERVGG
jgi:protein O-mannosyl-transferase